MLQDFLSLSRLKLVELHYSSHLSRSVEHGSLYCCTRPVVVKTVQIKPKPNLVFRLALLLIFYSLAPQRRVRVNPGEEVAQRPVIVLFFNDRENNDAKELDNRLLEIH